MMPSHGPRIASRREGRIPDFRQAVPWLRGPAGSVLADGVLATAPSHSLPGEADLHWAMVQSQSPSSDRAWPARLPCHLQAKQSVEEPRSVSSDLSDTSKVLAIYGVWIRSYTLIKLDYIRSTMRRDEGDLGQSIKWHINVVMTPRQR